MGIKNNVREWTAEELKFIEEVSQMSQIPSTDASNAVLSKIKDFFPSAQDRIKLHTQQIDVSECNDLDEKTVEVLDDGREQVFSAVGKTATSWEESIYKKLFCDIFIDRLKKRSEKDERILKDYMRNVMKQFSFETILWIKEALDSRKIANVFEIWTKKEKLSAAVEKDRQEYMNSIEVGLHAVLTTYIFRYQSKIEGLKVADDLKFIHNKYMTFHQSRDKSLPNLYKIIKNLQSDFIKSAKTVFEKSPFDYTAFVVLIRTDSIEIVCRDLPRALMHLHQNGNKTLKDVKMSELPYGKYYWNFFKKTGINAEGKRIFYSVNDVEYEQPKPLVLRLH
jgi:hypothetical protein